MEGGLKERTEWMGRWQGSGMETERAATNCDGEKQARQIFYLSIFFLGVCLSVDSRFVGIPLSTASHQTAGYPIVECGNPHVFRVFFIFYI